MATPIYTELSLRDIKVVFAHGVAPEHQQRRFIRRNFLIPRCLIGPQRIELARPTYTQEDNIVELRICTREKTASQAVT